jgi:hypothetical protein
MEGLLSLFSKSLAEGEFWSWSCPAGHSHAFSAKTA